MDVLGLKWHKTGTVGRLKIRLPRTGDSLGTGVDHRKYKEIGHSFGLGTCTSAEGRVVGAIGFRKTISD